MVVSPARRERKAARQCADQRPPAGVVGVLAEYLEASRYPPEVGITRPAEHREHALKERRRRRMLALIQAALDER